MKPPTAAAAAVFGLFLSPAAAGAAKAPKLDELLSREASPGVVILMVEHGDEPRVRDYWSAAVRHPDAKVRAATARAVLVAGRSDLVPVLGEALAAEEDRAALEELATASATLGDEAAVEALLERASRLPSWATPLVARVLARTRGPRALPLLFQLRSLGLSDEDELHFLEDASRGHAALLSPTGAAALREADVRLWRNFLLAAGRGRPADGLLAVSLAPELAKLHDETLFYLAWVTAMGRELPSVVSSALDAFGARLVSESGKPSFAWELLERVRGKKPEEQARWSEALSREDSSDLAGDLAANPVLWDYMTDAEVESAGVVRNDGPGATALEAKIDEALAQLDVGDGRTSRELAGRNSRPKRAVSRRLPPGPKRGAFLGPQETPEGSIRTLGGHPPGVLVDVLTVAKCKPKKSLRRVLEARTRFGPDGRARELQFPGEVPGGGCGAAAAALFRSSLAPEFPPLKGSVTETLVLPLQTDFVRCRADADAGIVPPVAVDSGRHSHRIREPKKIRDVLPIYPEAARQARVYGRVVLETVLAPAGCISGVKLLKSPDPRLSGAAFAAVLGWRYTPTLLDGRSVPVIMTVTVNFRLR